MMDLQAWISARPLVAAGIVWLVGTFVAFAFKARTPAEYSAMPPRLAAFLQLLGALFGDGRKVAAALVKVLTGRDLPPVAPAAVLVSADDFARARRRMVTPREGQDGFTSGEALGVLVSCSCAILLLLACVKPAPALDAAATIAKRNADYDAEVKACSAKHSRTCADFNQCQREVAVKYGARLRGHCEEVTPAEAVDAGLLPAGRL